MALAMNIIEGMKARKLAKENIFTDIFHGFGPSENLIK